MERDPALAVALGAPGGMGRGGWVKGPGSACHMAWPADTQCRRERHRAIPRRPVRLKIGPRIPPDALPFQVAEFPPEDTRTTESAESDRRVAAIGKMEGDGDAGWKERAMHTPTSRSPKGPAKHAMTPVSGRQAQPGSCGSLGSFGRTPTSTSPKAKPKLPSAGDKKRLAFGKLSWKKIQNKVKESHPKDEGQDPKGWDAFFQDIRTLHFSEDEGVKVCLACGGRSLVAAVGGTPRD